MAPRLDGRYRYLGLALISALSIAVVVAAGWWATRQSHDAIERQVRVSQVLAADERAATLRDAIRTARARLELTISNPVVTGVIRSGDSALLRATLASATRGTPVTGVLVTDPDGAVLAQSGRMPARPSDGRLGFRSSTDRSDAYMTMAASIRDGTTTIARVYQELSVRALSPHFVSPFTSFAGTGSLVTRDGTVVMTTPPGDLPREQTPELEVARRPIEGTDLAVVVSADASAASKPAAALVTRFAGLFLLTFVALLALIGGAVALLASLRRDLIRAREAAATMARTDALTNVGNRRALDDAMHDLETSDALVGVVLVDVDDLKSLNDTCGHGRGDEALRATASAITSVVRDTDLVCRIGGDEFIVLLTERGSARARAIAASIEVAVRTGRTEQLGGLSVSTGFDVCQGRDLHYGINRADDVLYRDKRLKRQAIAASSLAEAPAT